MPHTATQHPKILISAPELAELLAQPNPPVVLDVQWSIAQPNGFADYSAAHIPGARFIDMEQELSGPVGDGSRGRHPLPDPADLQETLRRLGVNAGQAVVVYDADTSLAASRAWWLLTYGGLEQVYLLNGGLAAWKRAGFEVASLDEAGSGEAREPATREPGDVVISYGHLPVLDLEDVPEFAASELLLDARAYERYTGEVEPIDPVGGHIPGAVSSPTTAHIHPDGTFLSPAQLREHYRQQGLPVEDSQVAVYCGSGVTAAHHIVALAQIGVPAALYPGSWSQWSRLRG